MTFLRASLVSAGLVMALGAPAAACDLHGPGQMAGFHRYNPFASTFQQLPDASRAAQSAADAETFAVKDKSARQDHDARRRQQALDDEEEARETAREKEARGNAQEGQNALS